MSRALRYDGLPARGGIQGRDRNPGGKRMRRLHAHAPSDRAPRLAALAASAARAAEHKAPTMPGDDLLCWKEASHVDGLLDMEATSSVPCSRKLRCCRRGCAAVVASALPSPRMRCRRRGCALVFPRLHVRPLFISRRMCQSGSSASHRPESVVGRASRWNGCATI